MTPRQRLVRTAIDQEMDPRLARAATADNASRQALLQAAIASDTQTGLATADMQSRQNLAGTELAARERMQQAELGQQRDLAGTELAARERMQQAELGQQRDLADRRERQGNQSSLRQLVAAQMGNVRPEYQGPLLKAAGLDLEGVLGQFPGSQAGQTAGQRPPGIFKPQLGQSGLARIASIMQRADEAEGLGQSDLADQLRQQAAQIERGEQPGPISGAAQQQAGLMGQIRTGQALNQLAPVLAEIGDPAGGDQAGIQSIMNQVQSAHQGDSGWLGRNTSGDTYAQELVNNPSFGGWASDAARRLVNQGVPVEQIPTMLSDMAWNAFMQGPIGNMQVGEWTLWPGHAKESAALKVKTAVANAVGPYVQQLRGRSSPLLQQVKAQMAMAGQRMPGS